MGASLLGMVVAYFAVPVNGPVLGSSVALDVVLTVCGIAALGWSILGQVRRYLVSGSAAIVDSLILTLSVVVVFFSLAFYVLQVSDPTQFTGLDTRLDSLYFTASTATTVGYGDVHASGQLARALVTIQLTFNLVFVAAVATLLSSRIRSVAEAGRSTRK